MIDPPMMPRLPQVMLEEDDLYFIESQVNID